MKTRREFVVAISVLTGLIVGGVASGAAFTPGNVVVYRVGDGVAALGNTGNAVFLDEYTPGGTLVQSIPLPTTATGSQRQLIASGTATSEGLMTRSADGQCLLLSGYGRDLGGAGSLAGTAAATVNRVVGRVSASATVDTSTALTDFADGNNPRGAASTNCNDLWVSGGAGGVRAAVVGGSTSTQLSTTLTNLRQPAIFDGQLYVSNSTGSSVRVGSVGSGTPSTSGQTIVNLPGYPTSGSPFAFFFADLTGAVPGVDTLYVAEDTTGGGQIQKYCLESGNWVARGAISAPAARGLAGVVGLGSVTLYATTGGGGASGGGSLYGASDVTGYGNNVSGSATTIASAAANTAFRGVALAPSNPPNAPPTIAVDSPVPLSHDLLDTTNRAIALTVADAETPAAALLVTAASSNAAVVPNTNLTITSGSGGARTLTLVPTGVGYATITVTVTDGNGSSVPTTFTYGVSNLGATPTTRFHMGAGDLSTGLALDAQHMLAASDEDQGLRLYRRDQSGPPLASFDFTASLGLTDTSGGQPREVDIEASTRVGSRLYWIGSQSNSNDAANRPNRDRLFGTDLSGSGAASTLTYAGRYDFLEEDLVTWDHTNVHGLGADTFGFFTSHQPGVDPKTPGGYNVEGLSMAPGSATTAYVAFRAPIVPASARTLALIVPVTNFTSLLSNLGGGTAGSAMFGAPIQLALGGRGIRSLECSVDGCLIVAGPSDESASFRIFTWTGDPSDAPQVWDGDVTGLNPEGIVELPPGPWSGTTAFVLLSDLGTVVPYGDGIANKDLPQELLRKSRSDVVSLGNPTPVELSSFEVD
jgi:Protein of unknown function (DUF3616)